MAAAIVEGMAVFTAVAVDSMEAVGTTPGDTTVALTALDQELCTAAGMGWAEVLQRRAGSTELEVRCRAEVLVTARL